MSEIIKRYTKMAEAWTRNLEWKGKDTETVLVAGNERPVAVEIPVGIWTAGENGVVYGEGIQAGSLSEAGVVYMFLTEPSGDPIATTFWKYRSSKDDPVDPADE